MADRQDCRQSEKIVDILEIFEKPPSIELPPVLSSHANDKSLNLEPNNSLALMARHSIEHGLPIPKNMLSHSEDALQSQDRSYQQKQADESYIKVQAVEEEHLIHTLNLSQLMTQRYDHSLIENTKNVLRNFGNAQNHYVLYHKKARAYIDQNISDPKKFDQWVRSLKLENFINFKKAWNAEENRLCTRVYKKLCWEFYTENAIPYVLMSRIKKNETRSSHLRYIYRFLQGLRNPEQFTYFRKS